MPEEKFETNLLRFIAAELYFSLGMQASRELYGKSYFSLGVGEKSAVDQLVLNSVGANFQGMTAELLASPDSKDGGWISESGESGAFTSTILAYPRYDPTTRLFFLLTS